MKIIRGLLLCCFSMLLTFTAAEPFFRANLQKLNLSMQESLETCVRPLAQISKKGLLPHDYIAIVGDSYAEGAGDWYIQSDRTKHLPFQASHVLHEKTGRDVVTFGSSGTGPLRYVLANLPASYEYINALAFLSFEEPKVIVVYFYEGNDIFDTLKTLRKEFSPTLDPAVVYDERKLNAFLDNYEKNEPHLKRARNFYALYNLQSAIYVSRSLINFYKYLRNGSEFPSAPQAAGSLKVMVGGDAVAIPDGLHWPEVDKTDEEIRMGIFVYKKCIERLRKRFPRARYGILYVPAPVSVYRYADDKVSQHYSSLVMPNSEKICAMVRKVAEELGVPFVDTRPRLRMMTQKKILHGPYDWKHFNKEGYEVFAEDLHVLVEKVGSQ